MIRLPHPMNPQQLLDTASMVVEGQPQARGTEADPEAETAEETEVETEEVTEAEMGAATEAASAAAETEAATETEAEAAMSQSPNANRALATGRRTAKMSRTKK